MKQLAPIALALLFALPAGALHAEPTDMTKAGVAAAEHWLALVDAGQGAHSWREASALLRATVTAEQWAGAVQAARAPFGEFKSRKLVSARYTTTLPGAPAGEYVVIQYEAAFARRTGVTETVTPMREADGSWKVSGYYIK